MVTEDGSAAIPFTRANVTRYTGEKAGPDRRRGPARLAWRHREFLADLTAPGGARDQIG